MLAPKATLNYRWWIVLSLVLGLVTARSFTAISKTSAQDNNFVFTAHGDHGAYNNSNTLASLKAEANTGAAFSLALGDMTYGSLGDEQQWCQTIQNILGPSHPFELVMGNHEDEDKLNGYIGNFVKYCPDRMNSQGIYGAEYFFDYPATTPIMRVIMIGAGNDWDWDGSGALETDEYFDYDSSTAARRAHLNWLIDKIDSARSAGISWIVVGVHKNCITLGEKGCEIGAELLNVLVEKKVDLILQGHDHTYQRTKQLSLGTGCSAITIAGYDPDCVIDDGADGTFAKGAGPILIVTGHYGGSGFSNVSSSDSEKGYFAKAMGGNGWFDFLQSDTLHPESSRGFVKFAVTHDQIRVEHVSTTNPNIGFSDVFSIVADASPPPSPNETATPTQTPDPSGFLTFTPTDDATIREDNPATNYGSRTSLEVDASSRKDFLVRFDVKGIGTQPIAKATLRLFAIDGSPSGGEFFGTANTAWNETSVTWNTAPADDGQSLDTLGDVAIGYWYEIDVTNLVTGDGPVSVRVSSANTNGVDYSSKESLDGNAPQLIVELGTSTDPPSTATPTMTPTAVFTATNTATNTATATPTPTMVFTASQTPTNTPTTVVTATISPTLIDTPVHETTLTLTPIADSYVNASQPTRNYGHSSALRTDESPAMHSYLRFEVPSVSGTIVSASLRIYANTDSNAGYNLYSTGNNWDETTLNFDNAPTYQDNMGSSGLVARNTWSVGDVTGFITGGGLYSFVMISGDNTQIRFDSREGNHAPELIIVVSDDPATTNTPANPPNNTPTSTSVPSNTPTDNPTMTATATNTSTPTDTPPIIPTSTETSSTMSFTPMADAFVYVMNPDTNYGSSTNIRTDGSPDMHSYMKFDMQSAGGTVTHAVLRVYANSASSVGYTVNRVNDNTWTESTLTYNNAPAVGTIVGISSAIAADTWTTIDVTALIADNNVLTMALTSTDSRAISLSSREGANPPELIVTFGDQPTATSTPIAPTNTPTPTVVPPGTGTNAGFQPQAPYYASFLYLWYQQPDPNGQWSYWNDYGNNPPQSWFSHYLPDYQPNKFDPASELYSSMNYDVFKWQVSKLAEAKQEVAIASWWGQGRKEDDALQTILHTYMSRADNPYPNLRWSIYYEIEAYSDESVDILVSNLEYIKTTLAGSPYYLTVDGKPVVFVYAGANDVPGTMTQRWKQANDRMGGAFYIVLKVFPGYASDAYQPDSWHQYAPAARSGQHGSYSAYVSPGFWLDDGSSSPRLPRNLSEFESAVIDMVNADVTWKLVETWNEWGEGTSVEPGHQVMETSSGEVLDPNGAEFGNAYIDILNAHLPPLESGNISTTAANSVQMNALPTATPTSATSLQIIESDDSLVQQTGKWTAHNTEVSSGGSYLYSNRSSTDQLSLTFKGKTLQIMYVQHPALGTFMVEVDGVVMQTVDSQGEEQFGQIREIDGLSTGSHLVRVYGQSDGDVIAIDAFVVETPLAMPTVSTTTIPDPVPAVAEGFTRIESDNVAVQQYGTWINWNASSASGGSYLFNGGQASSTLSLTFTGTQVNIIYTQHNKPNQMTIEIDGHVVASMGATDPSGIFGWKVSISQLPFGEHTVRVVPNATTVAIDAFEVETAHN